MQLDRITIKNYRSIENQTIRFDPNCRILIGKNEAGKSNILAACALLDPSTSVLATDLRETRDDEDPIASGEVFFVFRLSADERIKLKKVVSEKILSESDLCVRGTNKYTYRKYCDQFVESIYEVKIPNGERRYTYWDKTGFKLTEGWLSPSNGVDSSLRFPSKSGRKIPLSDLIAVRSDEVPVELLQYFEEANLGKINKAIAAIVSEIVSPQIPKVLYWRYSDASLLPAAVDIEQFKNDPSSCEPLRAMFSLAGQMDVREAIQEAQKRSNGLKNLLTRVARLTTAHLRSAWKEIGTIEIVLTPNGSNIDAAVKDAYNEYSFHRRSDGFKRLISFLILISARAASKDLGRVLFIQDEPDLGLHPSGVKALLSELIKLSVENYVLVSTHSIFMIDSERIDRHLVVQKSDETTSLQDVDKSQIKDEEVLFNALGYSLFELVRPSNLIFEGWRDKRLFLLYAKKKGGASRLIAEALKKSWGCAHAMGVKDVPRVASYFDTIGRKSTVISDGDEPAREKQGKFTQEHPDTPWFRYDELLGIKADLTAEDFISPVQARAALLRAFQVEGVEFKPPTTLWSEGNDAPVMVQLKALLQNNKVANDRIKAILNRFKTELFNNLATEHITDQYEKVAAALAEKMALKETIIVDDDDPPK